MLLACYLDGMENALVIGASGGIGRAVMTELTARGVTVTGLSRSGDGLDVTDESSVARILGDIEQRFDFIFVAIGVLGTPEKSLGAVTAAEMMHVFAVNAVGPALVLREVPRLLAKSGKVAVLSARVGSIGDNAIGGWYSYRASKAALNQIVHGASIELMRSDKEACVVALHPGTVATSFTAKYAGRHKTMPADAAAKKLVDIITALTPSQTGGFYDYAGEIVPW